jgi:hypothetical protein
MFDEIFFLFGGNISSVWVKQFTRLGGNILAKKWEYSGCLGEI